MPNPYDPGRPQRFYADSGSIGDIPDGPGEYRIYTAAGVSKYVAGFRLAAALLLRHREISVAAIEALPFVGDRDGAEYLADELTRRLGAIRYQKRLAGPGEIRRRSTASRRAGAILPALVRA